MRSVVAELHRRDPLLATVGWINLALAAVMLAAAPFDSRLVLGVSPWLKPMKFAVSIAIFVWTIAWLLHHVRDAGRAGLLVSRGIAAAMIAEIACIALQGARGTTSHYNVSTPFDALVFMTMAVAIVVNTVLGGVLLALYLRPVPLPRTYLWGIRLGLLVFLLGSLEGSAMILQKAHTVGMPDGGPGLPLVNWSTRAGDLRVAHGLGLHALQALPLTGYLISSTLPNWRPGGQLAALFAFAAGYLGLAAFLFWAASNGRPLFAI